MAALSAQRPGEGKKISAPVSADILSMAFRSPLLQATPPAMTILLKPVRRKASVLLATSRSHTAAWKEAQRSGRFAGSAADGFFLRYVMTAVFNPLKLKLRVLSCRSGRGKLMALGSP